MAKDETWANPAIRWRKERIQELLTMIQQEENAKIDELVAKFSIEHGLSDRKVKEYLKVLETEGKVQVDWFNGTVKAVD